MNKLYLLLAVTTLCAAASCKKEKDAQEQACPISNVLPDKIDHTYPSGVTLTSDYRYDALSRVTQITNEDSNITVHISYQGSDTIYYNEIEIRKDGTRGLARRTSNSSGDHLGTDIYYAKHYSLVEHYVQL